MEKLLKSELKEIKSEVKNLNPAENDTNFTPRGENSISIIETYQTPERGSIADDIPNQEEEKD